VKSRTQVGWILACVAGLAGSCLAQGSLTPPGAPAPTMKTLQQIEPRTPLESGSPGVSIDPSGTITISQSGSYYLTENLTVTSGNGITINAYGVTVDMQGFTIRSTLADSAFSGIDINAARVSIYNGHIESGTTYDGGAGGDQYTGPGFDHGIYVSSLHHYTGIRIRDISVVGCDDLGIYIPFGDSLVESCTVKIVGSVGIWAGIVRQCTANYCGSIAIYGLSSVSDCRGFSEGDDGIQAKMVANSYGRTTGTATTDDGINAATVQNSVQDRAEQLWVFRGRGWHPVAGNGCQQLWSNHRNRHERRRDSFVLGCAEQLWEILGWQRNLYLRGKLQQRTQYGSRCLG